jgi:hypothetical protein
MKNTTLTGLLFVFAAVTFWLSWFLMPDPSTTDTEHIFAIVKQARGAVWCSVVLQIASSAIYIWALFLLATRLAPNGRTLTGLVLFGIGAMGMCADSFFHLLAYYMTAGDVSIQADVVKVMDYMQTSALAFLVPLLLCFFAGGLVIATGLQQQAVVTSKTKWFLGAALVIGLAGPWLARTIFQYDGRFPMLLALGSNAIGHICLGVELIDAKRLHEKRESNELKLISANN